MKLTAKQFRQGNISKVLSELSTIWSTFNMDLQSDVDLLKVSPRLRINTTSVSNQGVSIAFKTFDARVFTIAGTRVFKNSDYTLLTAFAEDASSGAITTYNPDYSDMTTFNSLLVTTGTGNVMSKAVDGSGTGAWTSRATLTSATSPHKLNYFKKYNRIYYIDSFKTIKSMSVDTAWPEATSGDYFIDLTYAYGYAYTMESDQNYIWIGTVNTNPAGVLTFNHGAAIYRWDGISSTAYEFPVKAKGVLAISKDDRGVIYAIDSNGALLQQTASGFEEIDRLPLRKEYLINAVSGVYNAFIHPNGLTFTKNGTFKILINNLVGDSAGSIKENLQSGIWEWSKETGFIHNSSFTYNTLADSTITDYGQNRISRAGALAELDIYSASASGKPMLICGATYYTDASSTASGIFTDDPLNTIQKYGYFVTGWIKSSAIKETWKKIAVKYRKLLNSSDRVIVKYRVAEVDPVYIDITWVTTTQFSSSTDLTNYVGYEAEIIQGTGSGKCAHITSITGNNPWKANLDETFTGVTTGTAKARLQRWVKHLEVSDQLTESKVIALGKVSERIQIKVCMEFTGDNELHELIVMNQAQEQLE